MTTTTTNYEKMNTAINSSAIFFICTEAGIYSINQSDKKYSSEYKATNGKTYKTIQFIKITTLENKNIDTPTVINIFDDIQYADGVTVFFFDDENKELYMRIDNNTHKVDRVNYVIMAE
jgi:hypothetical protein